MVLLTQAILRRSGVYERYWEMSRADSNVMRIYSVAQRDPLFVMALPRLLERFIPPSPETNRQLLRDALLGSLPAERCLVSFNTPIATARVASSPPLDVAAAQLLGADGAVLGKFDLV